MQLKNRWLCNVWNGNDKIGSTFSLKWLLEKPVNVDDRAQVGV